MEAAFTIPIVFVLLLLLLQPGIILYDRMVMQSAAAEACRSAVTAGSGLGNARLEELIKRHLGAVPDHELFHVHDGACSWQVEIQGGEGDDWVRVTISNRLKLLPLVDATASLVGAADAQGCLSIQVSRSAQTQPTWAVASGLDPSAWTRQRG